MPTWTNAPPDPLAATPFRIVRTPSTTPLKAIITSEDVLGCNTHYYQRRTQPCEAPDCQACAEGTPWRWHGYVAAFDPTTREHFIFEFPAGACETFAAYRNTHGSLRGCYFQSARAPAKPNGRVLIRCKPADLERDPIPAPPNLIALLCKIWSIPTSTIKTPDRLKDYPAATIKRRTNNRLTRTPDA